MVWRASYLIHVFVVLVPALVPPSEPAIKYLKEIEYPEGANFDRTFETKMKEVNNILSTLGIRVVYNDKTSFTTSKGLRKSRYKLYIELLPVEDQEKLLETRQQQDDGKMLVLGKDEDVNTLLDSDDPCSFDNEDRKDLKDVVLTIRREYNNAKENLLKVKKEFETPNEIRILEENEADAIFNLKFYIPLARDQSDTLVKSKLDSFLESQGEPRVMNITSLVHRILDYTLITGRKSKAVSYPGPGARKTSHDRTCPERVTSKTESSTDVIQQRVNHDVPSPDITVDDLVMDKFQHGPLLKQTDLPSTPPSHNNDLVLSKIENFQLSAADLIAPQSKREQSTHELQNDSENTNADLVMLKFQEKSAAGPEINKIEPLSKYGEDLVFDKFRSEPGLQPKRILPRYTKTDDIVFDKFKDGERLEQDSPHHRFLNYDLNGQLKATVQNKTKFNPDSRRGLFGQKKKKTIKKKKIKKGKSPKNTASESTHVELADSGSDSLMVDKKVKIRIEFLHPETGLQVKPQSIEFNVLVQEEEEKEEDIIKTEKHVSYYKVEKARDDD